MSKRFLNDGGRFFRRGSRLVGQGQPIATPIADTLPPADYEGAVAYGNDGKLYYSDGVAWVIPTDDAEVSRPFGQIPTTPEQQTQLRLSAFRSPAGLEQTGIFFEISTNGVDFVEPMTRTVLGPAASLYQIVFPDDGFEAGDQILWRASYLAAGGGQSEFSVPLRQTFPVVIQTPSPVTAVEAIVGSVEVTPFTSPSAFGLSYFQTETEFYTVDGETLIETVTHGLGATTRVPEIPSLPEQTLFAFRSRYAGRTGPAGSLFYSEWSQLRVFFNGVGAMLLEYNLDAALSRTVNLPIGVYDATGLNVTVDWGDGTTDTYTTGGVKSHIYASGVGPIVDVSIRGTMRQYGGDTNQQGLKRVITWGLKLGLTSLREALRNARATLESIPNSFPPEVTSMQGFFRGAILTNAGLNIADLDTSNITTMESCFESAQSNKPLTNWVALEVLSMRRFCYRNGIFNQPIGHLQTPKCLTWEHAFGTDTISMVFNQPVNGLDMSACENINYMFGVVSGFADITMAFNQPINLWDVSKVTTAVGFVRGARLSAPMTSRFNQDISALNFAKLQNASLMFALSDFNNGGSAAITDMAFPELTNASSMFSRAPAFNQPLNNWVIPKLSDVSLMLSFCPFNHPLNLWANYSASFNQLFQLFNGGQFNQDVSMWPLRAAGVNLNGQFSSNIGVENASRLYVGWANSVNDQNGPRNVTANFTSLNFDNRDLSALFPGKRFTDAVTARAWLVAARSVIVSGAANATANGTYVWNAVSSTYVNSVTNWFFIKIGATWELRDASNVVQATSGAGDLSEPYLETWGGALAGATLLLGGAGWTITGGNNVT